MPGKIAESKKQISLVLEREIIDRLDREAADMGTNRTAVINTAIAEHFEKDKALDVIQAKLDAIQSQQVANTAAIVEAVRNQPIAVAEKQPEALPEPEPEPAYEKTWFGLYRKVK